MKKKNEKRKTVKRSKKSVAKNSGNRSRKTVKRNLSGKVKKNVFTKRKHKKNKKVVKKNKTFTVRKKRLKNRYIIKKTRNKNAEFWLEKISSFEIPVAKLSFIKGALLIFYTNNGILTFPTPLELLINKENIKKFVLKCIKKIINNRHSDYETDEATKIDTLEIVYF